MRKLFIVLIFLLISFEIFAQRDTFVVIQNGDFSLTLNFHAQFNQWGGGKVCSFKELPILSDGGFSLSGLVNNELWASGNIAYWGIEDFNPGPVGSNPVDEKNRIFTVYSHPFDQSWVDWKNAVALGASFYDGDNDGKYNPIDKNNNAKWNSDEDCPDYFGNTTYWLVVNDNVSPSIRRFNDQKPLGLEIQQTATVFRSLKEVVIIRYRVIYKGLDAEKLDSVIFSFNVDPDMGDYFDDLSGCDTINQVGYSYHKNIDTTFGVESPSIGIQLIQGPVSYIPEKTYVDIDGNNHFDILKDLPLDTAVSTKGILGMAYLPGASNGSLNSFYSYYNSHTGQPIPYNSQELRNLHKGLSEYGNRIDPCTWDWGNGNTLSYCNNINPFFMYSGDPVAGTGWLLNYGSDQRWCLNTEPFTLYRNQPADIWVAYIVAAKDSALGSVAELKRIAAKMKLLPGMNFGIDVPAKETPEPTLPDDYYLLQNYPNPFNPETTIKYGIDKKKHVKITVYDLIGNTIAVLVDAEKEAGNYFVKFNGGGLQSGVYFYRLTIGEYSNARAMMYLK